MYPTAARPTPPHLPQAAWRYRQLQLQGLRRHLPRVQLKAKQVLAGDGAHLRAGGGGHSSERTGSEQMPTRTCAQQQQQQQQQA